MLLYIISRRPIQRGSNAARTFFWIASLGGRKRHSAVTLDLLNVFAISSGQEHRLLLSRTVAWGASGVVMPT